MKCKTCRGHGLLYPIVGGNGNGIETVCPDCGGTGHVRMKMKTKGIIAVMISVIFYGLLFLMAWRLGV